MPLNPDAVGARGPSHEISWTSRDAMLYALGVGAGVDELEYTTENSAGIELRTLPTFPVVLGSGRDTWPDIGSYDMVNVLHGTQGVRIHRPVPPDGAATRTVRVSAMWDKGSAAVVELEATAVDSDGQKLFTTTTGMFVRGAGGWGGDRGPATAAAAPEGPPDVVVDYAIPVGQALLYRLSGDRNPLHSDPAFAARAGFERPILHGLCTFGYSGRAVLAAIGAGAAVTAIEGRFVSPTYPGEQLTVEIWTTEAGAAAFTARVGDRVVFDRGRAEVASQ